VITIIDYGMGNLGSVKNMLKKIGATSIITSNKDDILKASKLLLPGVGAFDRAISNLNELDLITTIKNRVISDKVPILGICLGMQLLLKNSEEGVFDGFGIIDGIARKFDSTKLKVPHMGWNEVREQKKNKLFINMDNNRRFYFVHSFGVECCETDILTTTIYGEEFVSSFLKENVIGVQFHPEKSHKYGMTFLKNFVENY